MKTSALKKTIFATLASGGLFLVSAFMLLHLRSEIARESQELGQLESRLVNLEDELRLLEVNLDDSLQPHVLRNRVQGMLNDPQKGQVVLLSNWVSSGKGGSVR